MKIINYIGGEFTVPTSKEYLDNINPATGNKYSVVASSGKEDVDLAISEAKKAFSSWAALSRDKRAAYLLKLAELIEKNREELSLAESIDTGKPVSVTSQVDIPRSAANFRFFAEKILEFDDIVFPGEKYGTNRAIYSPLGVVGCITPWNLPLYLLTWKIAPALAAGNTVVAKPSEITPMTAFLLCKLIQKADIPPGVLNIVHGTGSKVGETLCKHPEVKAISFTGSTATGRAIANICAPQFKKVSLEMGGKNPNIIFKDCDFKKALEGSVKAAFANQGQICLCGSRLFIERPLYNEFKNALIQKTKDLLQGDPLHPKTQQGAVVGRFHFDKIMNAIDLAKKEGATILTGGDSAKLSGINKNGFFIKPTLIEGLDSSCRINQEEIFGPMATLTPFDTEEEVIFQANNNRYGLSGSIWSKDLKKASRVARQIDSGILWINTWMMRDLRTPFGGLKESGMGKEGGHYALSFFSSLKNICTGPL